MELCHGSNIVVSVPEIRTPSYRLDFGTGFYTITSFDQAKRWSINKAKLEKNGSAIVSVFTVPDNFLQNENLNILDFKKADEQWLCYCEQD